MGSNVINVATWSSGHVFLERLSSFLPSVQTFKLLELSHQFDKVNQSYFFRKYMLASKIHVSLYMLASSHFHDQLVRSNDLLKFLKMYVSMAMFWKMFKPDFYISTKYGQRFFRFENFNYKGWFFFELRAVELAISFCWFLPISESFHKNVTLPQSCKFMCPLAVKLQPFQCLAKFV